MKFRSVSGGALRSSCYPVPTEIVPGTCVLLESSTRESLEY